MFKTKRKGRVKALAIAGAMMLSLAQTISLPAIDVKAAFEAKHYDIRENGGKWNGYYYVLDGQLVTDAFFCDGEYTYFLQADGSPMKDRLTYHPDGEHIIYFDGQGHEVFSNFYNVKKSISGDEVDDLCFFDVYGYMYVNFLTFDQEGKKLYYANPYGVMDQGTWFQFAADAGEVAAAYGAGEGTWAYAYKDGRVDPNSIGKKDSYTPVEKVTKSSTTYRADGTVKYQSVMNDKGNIVTSNALRADGTVYSSSNYEYDENGDSTKTTTTYFDGYSDVNTYGDKSYTSTSYTQMGGTLSSYVSKTNEDGSHEFISYRHDGSVDHKSYTDKNGSTSEGFKADGSPSWKDVQVYDNAGMTIKSESYWNGKLNSVTEYLDYGYTIKITSYDEEGNVTGWSVKDYSGETGKLDIERNYDAEGAYLGKTEYYFDDEHNNIRTVSYDAEDKVTYDSGNGDASDFSDEYDANGKLVKSTYLSTSVWTDSDGNVTTHVYKSIREYNEYEDCIKSTSYTDDKLSSYTVYEYDGYGSKTKETEYDADDTVTGYKLYLYTDFGAPLKEEQHRVYDGKDNIISVTCYEYDEKQICTRKYSVDSYTGEEEKTYEEEVSQFGGLHDNYGRSVNAEIPWRINWTYSYEYDEYGYVTKQTMTSENGTVLETTVYEY
ncbi:MAG: hypothetical protein IJ141_03010 [Lachnospiraceae bacterium]|nr:hypothetical protein [Lachnospiraceae bacterium]